MPNFDLKEVHSNQQASIDFDSLVRSLPDARDKLLCACIATFADIGLAENFISHLVNLPEPVDYNKVMFGVAVKNVMGLNVEQAARLGLNAEQFQQIKDYVGLREANPDAKARAAGIRE